MVWSADISRENDLSPVSPGNRESGCEVNHWNFAIQMEAEQKPGLTWAAGNVLANFLGLKVRVSPCLNHEREMLSIHCFKTRFPTEVNPTR